MILFHREEIASSSFAQWIIVDSRLTTHQYHRLAVNFSDIIGKVTFLVNHHRRAWTIEKIRRQLLPSFFSIFALYRTFAIFSTSMSLHGELSASVSWERRFVSFPSRFHAIAIVSTGRYRRDFLRLPFHSTPFILLLGKKFRIEWKTRGGEANSNRDWKIESSSSSNGKLSSGN